MYFYKIYSIELEQIAVLRHKLYVANIFQLLNKLKKYFKVILLEVQDIDRIVVLLQ